MNAHGKPNAPFGDDVIEHLNHLVFMQNIVAPRPLFKKELGRARLLIHSCHMHDLLTRKVGESDRIPLCQWMLVAHPSKHEVAVQRHR